MCRKNGVKDGEKKKDGKEQNVVSNNEEVQDLGRWALY